MKRNFDFIKKGFLSTQNLNKLILIILISLLTAGLEYLGLLRGFETATADIWLLLSEPLKTPNTVIVAITEHDYKEIFHESSPLNPEKLEDIIEAIAAGGPSVIGVDLDTSSERFKDLISPSGPPIVWAQGALYCDDKISPLGVLGGSELEAPSLTGIALLPQDSDNTIRHYYREYYKVDNYDPVPSFPWAIVNAYCDQKNNVNGENRCNDIRERDKTRQDNRWLLNTYEVSKLSSSCKQNITTGIEDEALNYGFTFISASQVLEASKGADWRSKGPLRNKIVLLGGFYHAARDEYLTPSGSLPGVVILRQAIEAELQGLVIPKPHVLLLLTINIVLGIAFSFMFNILSRRLFIALAVSVISILVLPFLCSLLISRSFALVGYFIPVLVAVLIQGLYENAKSYQNRLIALLSESEVRKSN